MWEYWLRKRTPPVGETGGVGYNVKTRTENKHKRAETQAPTEGEDKTPAPTEPPKPSAPEQPRRRRSSGISTKNSRYVPREWQLVKAIAETQGESTAPVPAKTEVASLKPRELKLWAVIQRGSKGPTYCREVDAFDGVGIAPPRKGIWKDGPRTYLAAYNSGDPRLVHWIQDEKHKIQKKAKVAKTRKELASE